jgi:hypothetical protein
MDTKPLRPQPGPEKYALEKWRTGGLDKQDFFVLVRVLMAIRAMIPLCRRCFADWMQG